MNNFLYLIGGAGPDGDLVSQAHSAEDEDDAEEELDTRVSGLGRSLTAGTYTVEAATHRPGETGIFVLTIYPW